MSSKPKRTRPRNPAPTHPTASTTRPARKPPTPQPRPGALSLQLGNQTAFAAAHPLEPFEFAVAHGFTAFEFFPDRGPFGQGGWDQSDLDAPTRRQIRALAAERGIALSVHAPLDFQPLRESESDRLYSTVALAADLGARMVNLHLDLSLGTARFLDALGPTLLATAAAGLQLTLENTVWTGPADFNDFFAALRDAPPQPVSHVGMCLDLGHANLCAATRNDCWQFLDRLADSVPIRHLHLHENHGDHDSHLTLFTGPAGDNPAGLAGILSRLAQRRFEGCGIFEQWPQPPSLLLAARERLERLLLTLGEPASPDAQA